MWHVQNENGSKLYEGQNRTKTICTEDQFRTESNFCKKVKKKNEYITNRKNQKKSYWPRVRVEGNSDSKNKNCKIIYKNYYSKNIKIVYI